MEKVLPSLKVENIVRLMCDEKLHIIAVQETYAVSEKIYEEEEL
jgi:hypothetical protein